MSLLNLTGDNSSQDDSVDGNGGNEHFRSDFSPRIDGQRAGGKDVEGIWNSGKSYLFKIKIFSSN